MVVGDPKSYSATQKGTPDSPIDETTMWNYGVEAWCNLEGQYMTIAADLSHLHGQSYKMSICSLGIMGAEYRRSVGIQSAITVHCLDKVTLQIEKISAVQTIGNTLDIQMRQVTGNELFWVSLK